MSLVSGAALEGGLTRCVPDEGIGKLKGFAGILKS